MTWQILTGDCIDLMRGMPDASVDAVVTDPPYEIGFMAKGWDKSGIANSVEMWSEVLRVLKPGGHLLSFAATRTYHRMVCAIEDAGFEIRDQLAWMFGSGFPKSLDLSKAIDKAEGVEFEAEPASGVGFMNPTGDGGFNATQNKLTRTGESTQEAKKWEGWGTALKPAHEPIVLARKPLAGTVAANVQEYGTGAINVDGCRVEFASENDLAAAAATAAAQRSTGDQNKGRHAYGQFINGEASIEPYLAKMNKGRWPSNVLLDEESAKELDRQSGTSTSKKGKPRGAASGDGWGMTATGSEYDDHGGASRFFYIAKVGRGERSAGLEGVTNHHPTVKPIDLMRYLIRLVTPPEGTVLDPFTGSGSTGIAAVLEGKNFIGCEQNPEYVEIAEARIKWWEKHPEGLSLAERLKQEAGRAEREGAGQESLFGEMGAAA